MHHRHESWLLFFLLQMTWVLPMMSIVSRFSNRLLQWGQIWWHLVQSHPRGGSEPQWRVGDSVTPQTPPTTLGVGVVLKVGGQVESFHKGRSSRTKDKADMSTFQSSPREVPELQSRGLQWSTHQASCPLTRTVLTARKAHVSVHQTSSCKRSHMMWRRGESWLPTILVSFTQWPLWGTTMSSGYQGVLITSFRWVQGKRCTTVTYENKQRVKNLKGNVSVIIKMIPWKFFLLAEV